MCYLDTHYGHVGDVFEVEGYSKDRAVSCGQDRQVIFWKMGLDTQLLYKNPQNDTECLTTVDNSFFLTGSEHSVIDLWTYKKKKPIFKASEVQYDHGNKRYNWVTSIEALRNTDLFASGGINSPINVFKLNKKDKTFDLIKAIGEDNEGYF